MGGVVVGGVVVGVAESAAVSDGTTALESSPTDPPPHAAKRRTNNGEANFTKSPSGCHYHMLDSPTHLLRQRPAEIPSMVVTVRHDYTQTMPADNATTRFSDRVRDYVASRPSYPSELLPFLATHDYLAPAATVADIGAGTGIMTRLLLDAGHTVHAVEPNAAMRHYAEAQLEGVAGFHSHAGRAEATGLADGSVDMVIGAQAFHWFDPAATAREVARILVPGGYAVWVWNNRCANDNDFQRDYERLLQTHAIDYDSVRRTWSASESLGAFFAAGTMATTSFDNHQLFDLDGLRGRLLSSSYAPNRGDPRCPAMLADLEALFARHARRGRVRMDYLTEVYVGWPRT